jgi:hypothetical protein
VQLDHTGVSAGTNRTGTAARLVVGPAGRSLTGGATPSTHTCSRVIVDQTMDGDGRAAGRATGIVERLIRDLNAGTDTEPVRCSVGQAVWKRI